MSTEMEVKPLKTASGLLAVYISISATYIIISSLLASQLVDEVEDLVGIEILKGVGFIILTGFLLFYISFRYLKRIQAAGEHITSQQEIILESERRAMAGVFAASIAHDANNLLATLSISLEILRHKNANLSEDEEIEHIQAAIHQLTDLNRRLMNVGRDQLVNEKVPADLTLLTHSTLELAKSNTKLRRCKVSTLIEEEVCVLSNPSLFQRSLLNLLFNAAEATYERGEIRVVLEQIEGLIRLTVEDNGEGINDEQKKQIFEPFFSTKSDGNGLGLLAVKACAEIHGGKVRVETSSLGGAAFIIEFPAVAVPADEVMVTA